MTEKNTAFQLFASIGENIRPEFESDDTEWENSPFAWIRSLPAASKGKFGTRLISSWCEANGIRTGSSPGSDADILINGNRAEIKFSTLWKTGNYTFQQIRDQDYKFLIALGISPLDAHCWIIPKKTLYKYVIGHQPQHTGSGGTDTFWFRVQPSNPPVWLENHGGTLNIAIEILKTIRKKR